MKFVLVNISLALIIIICIYLLSAFIYLKFQSVKINRSWNSISGLFGQKIVFCSDLLSYVIDNEYNEPELIKYLTQYIAEFHSAKTPGQIVRADKKVSLILAKFGGISQKYPDVSGDDRYTEINMNMIKIEEKIAFSSPLYNELCENYNSKISNRLVGVAAAIFNFKKKGLIM